MACEKDFLRSFIPIIFAMAAFFMGLLGNMYCETIGFESTTAGAGQLSFGVWNYMDFEVVTLQPNNNVVVYETCFNYPDGTYFDAKWKTAKAFSMMTVIIGGVATLWACLSPCWYVGVSRWKSFGCIFLIMTLFQGLTLIFLGSNACLDNATVAVLANDNIVYNQSCVFAWGTKINIAAVVCWFVAGVMMMTAIIPPPVRPERPVETQTVTYSQTEQPDGTKVITENVVKGAYVSPESEVPAAQDAGEP